MIEALVLARRSFKEFDEMVSFYSKEAGKLELTARGTKKTVSKNSPFLEVFSYVHLSLVEGKDRQYITSVQSIAYFSKIRKNFQKSWQASFAVAILEKLLKPLEKNSQIFDIVVSWLHFLNEVSETKEVLLDALLLKIVSLLGFEPNLQTCIFCGRTLETEKMYFSFSSGGLLCQQDKLSHREEVLSLISLSTLLAFRYILNRSWREIYAFTSVETSKEIHTLVYSYIVYTTENTFEDWAYPKTFFG